MNFVRVPKGGYQPKYGVIDTQRQILFIKDHFQRALAKTLNLERISAPLFVYANSGLNDTLNGTERPVSFDIKAVPDSEVQVVQSLAKWKRVALGRYGFEPGRGLYTDMNAIRRDEDLGNLHSVYVDQWDWEIVITRGQRTEEMLRSVVTRIYDAILSTHHAVCKAYPLLKPYLPDQIHFLTTQELEHKYPNLSPKDREHAVCAEFGAVFLMQIGATLESGSRHDGRAPDYDDWSLNGDILIWYPVLQMAVELSSMGIRVDEKSLVEQCRIAECEERLSLPYHRDLIENKIPLTIGGGIGQSRLCMIYMEKAHIGEVQASVWPDEMVESCKNHNMYLL